MKYFIILLLTLIFVGFNCSSFDENFYKVQTGHSRDQVRLLLGDPNLRIDGIVRQKDYWGPQEGLESIIGTGMPYEEWQYKNNKYDYYIWFSSTTRKPKSNWLVIDKAKYPEGALFETNSK